jgi:hypothetical protein
MSPTLEKISAVLAGSGSFAGFALEVETLPTTIILPLTSWFARAFAR